MSCTDFVLYFMSRSSLGLRTFPIYPIFSSLLLFFQHVPQKKPVDLRLAVSVGQVTADGSDRRQRAAAVLQRWWRRRVAAGGGRPGGQAGAAAVRRLLAAKRQERGGAAARGAGGGARTEEERRAAREEKARLARLQAIQVSGGWGEGGRGAGKNVLKYYIENEIFCQTKV